MHKDTRRLMVLAGTMLATGFVASVTANDAEARRLVPERPSVEVRLEALRQLRDSVTGDVPFRKRSAPQANVASAPAASAPRYIPFGAPTPPPASPPPAQLARQAPPALPQSRQAPVIATPDAPRSLLPQSQFAASNMVPPKPEPALDDKPVKTPIVAQSTSRPAKTAPAPIVDEPAPSGFVEEEIDIIETPPSENVAEFSLEDMLARAGSADAQSASQEQIVDEQQEDISAPLSLPPMDEDNGPPPEFAAELAARDTLEAMPDIEATEAEAIEELPPLDIPLEMPVDNAQQDLAVLEMPPMDIAPDMPDATESLDLSPPMDDMPPLDMPDMDAAEMQVEPVEPALTEVNIADEMPPSPPQDIATATPSRSSQDEEEGLLPTLSTAFSSFLGGKEKAESATDAPPVKSPLPPVQLSQNDNVPGAALPPLPPRNNATGANDVTSDPNSLPPLPEFNNGGDADVFGAPELPALPPLNAQLDASSSPASDSTQATIDRMLPELPPLPGNDGGDADALERQLASLPPVDAGESLPPLQELDIAGYSNQDAALTVLFSQSETEVPLAYQQPLITLSKELIKDGNSQIKVVAYASSTDDQRSIARRISLARALAVRAFLIDLGIDNVRISVQALGNEVPEGPTERADVIVSSGA